MNTVHVNYATIGDSWAEEYKETKEYYILNGQRCKNKTV